MSLGILLVRKLSLPSRAVRNPYWPRRPVSNGYFYLPEERRFLSSTEVEMLIANSLAPSPLLLKLFMMVMYSKPFSTLLTAFYEGYDVFTQDNKALSYECVYIQAGSSSNS